MEKILFVNACIRENSRTLELAKHVLDKISGDIEEVKLNEIDFKPLDLTSLELRDIAKRNNDFSNPVFELAKQFSKVDTIVIAAPYWDLMFPAVVKNYFEMVTVNGLTFTYGPHGIPQGLCNAKKLIYVTTSGGPIIKNFGYEYIESLAKMFYGIQNVSFVSAQGLDIQGSDVSKIMVEAKKQII